MIAVSIVTYKTNEAELGSLLNCLLNDAIYKVWIVDNSPTDKLRVFSNLSSKIEYIFGHGNIGYGAAHNIAIRKSIECEAKYHIVVNPDIYFEKGVIEALSDYMDKNVSIGHVMPKIVDINGELQYLCKLLPTPMDLIGRRFIKSKKYVEKRNEKFEMRLSGYDKIMDVPFLSGCFMFLRVEALNKVNGFSDRYFMYCEDIDLCRRIGEQYKTIYYPYVSVVHAHKKESFKSRKMLVEHIKSAIKYFNYWGWFFDDYRKNINSKSLNQF